MNVVDAEEYTAALGQVVAGGYRQVALGVRLGVPQALGITTREWVEDRLGGYVKLSIPERREAVAELTADGMSQRQVAEVLGVAHTTVQRDVAPGTDVPGEVNTEARPSVGGTSVPPPPPHVTRNSGEIEWYTPARIIDAARLVLGDIDLDPASSPLANETVRASRYYTADDDGLAQPWAGRVWMNPPYSTGLVERFVVRAVEDYAAGSVTAAVVLTNNSTDTRWWQRLAAAASAVCFPARRIRFVAPAGEQNTPLQGQTIAYLGADTDRFVTAFSALGSVR